MTTAKKTTQAATKDEVAKQSPRIKVTTKKNGFRRAGIEWQGSTELLVSDLTAEQLAMINAEPMLIVEAISTT